jgi:hypothetical protein
MDPTDEALYAKPYTQLQSLSDEELVERHDKIAVGAVNVSYYLAELSRRTVERQGNQMVRLTRVIAALTVVNVLAVVVIGLIGLSG